MTAISITLPNGLAFESKKIASKLGVSRSEFIRMAVAHEIERAEKDLKIKAIISSFNSMKKSKEYMNESSRLENELSEQAFEDEDGWWE